MIGALTFEGHPLARFLALSLSVAGIAVALLAGPVEPSGLAFQVKVTNLVLDIGILITLSSGDVRRFHLRRGGRRDP